MYISLPICDPIKCDPVKHFVFICSVNSIVDCHFDCYVKIAELILWNLVGDTDVEAFCIARSFSCLDVISGTYLG